MHQLPTPVMAAADPPLTERLTTGASRALNVNSGTMSASTLRLSELPVEVLEQILVHLPGQDIVKVEVVRRVVVTSHDSALTSDFLLQVSRQFQDLTRNSPALRYKRDLFSAGLAENPRSPCDFAQRRKLCEEYDRKWSSAGRIVMTAHELPKELSFQRHSTTTHGGDLISSRNFRNGRLDFLHLPPATSHKPIKWWSTPPFPFHVAAYAIHPPCNIIAAAEVRER